MTISTEGQLDPDTATQQPSRLTRTTLLLMPVLAGLGPFASFTPGVAGAPYAYRILIALAALPALGMLLRNRQRDALASALLLTTLAFALWGSLALGWTPNTDRGGRQLVGILISLLGCWVAIGLAGTHPAGLRALRRGFVLAAATLAAVGLWQYTTGNNLWTLTGQPFNFAGNPLIGTFINPNNYAAFLLGCLGPILATAITGTRRSILLAVSLILVLGWIMLHTESRTGLFGLAFIALTASLMVAVSRPKSQTPLLVAGLAAAVVAVVNISRIGAKIDRVSQGTSASDDLRIQLSKIAWQYFLDSNGLGIGPAGFEARLEHDPSVEAMRVLPPHNTFLEVASEYGVLVFLPFIFLIIALITSAINRRRSGSSRGAVAHRVDLLSCIAAIIAGGLVASTLIADPGWWLLISYAILLTRQQRLETSAARHQEAPDDRRLTVARTR